MEYEVVVVGAGAAGLISAGVAATKGRRVLLLEKMERPARKVRITGKGRCNITNTRSRDEFLDHLRNGRDFFTASFDNFDNRKTVDFFEHIGLPLSVERGDRVFPQSGKAADVAFALQNWCMDKGVTIKCNASVTDILVRSGEVCGVRIAGGDTVDCRQVIIATGGMSYPATGSTGDGYRLAHRLGHTIVPVRPSLTPLECDIDGIDKLHGLLLKNVSVGLVIESDVVAVEFGELEFFDYSRGRNVPGAVPERAAGVGGAVVLRLSRIAVDAIIDGKKTELHVDLKSALTIEKLTARIEREKEGLPASSDVTSLLRKLLPREMIPVVARMWGHALRKSMRDVDTADCGRLAAILKKFILPVSDYRPFEEAVVTAGGGVAR